MTNNPKKNGLVIDRPEKRDASFIFTLFLVWFRTILDLDQQALESLIDFKITIPTFQSAEEKNQIHMELKPNVTPRRILERHLEYRLHHRLSNFDRSVFLIL